MPADALKQQGFLIAYRAVGTVTEAAEIARISRHTHALWMKDAGYRARFLQERKAYEEAYLQQVARLAEERQATQFAGLELADNAEIDGNPYVSQIETPPWKEAVRSQF